MPSENFTDGTLNVHAHLSPFSAPEESNQPVPRGSVIASESSCAETFARAARPCECVVVVSCGSQPESPSRLKKNANWIGTPLQLPQLCHAQYPACPRLTSV